MNVYATVDRRREKASSYSAILELAVRAGVGSLFNAEQVQSDPQTQIE